MTKLDWGNPYTHEEHERVCINNNDAEHSCDWCGREMKKLYIYDKTKGQFCNKDCWESYHY